MWKKKERKGKSREKERKEKKEEKERHDATVNGGWNMTVGNRLVERDPVSNKNET